MKRYFCWHRLLCMVILCSLFMGCQAENPVSERINTFCSNENGGSTDISTVPIIISAPGTYVVKKDLCFLQNATTNTAISVQSNGVTVDFDGHSLQIAGSTAVGVSTLNRTNVALMNGSIKGTQVVSSSVGPVKDSQFGFMAENSAHIRVNNMVFQRLGAGVNFTKTHDGVITDSLFEDGVTGIQVAAFGFGTSPNEVTFVDGTTIERSHIRNMSQYGVYLRANMRNLFIDQTVIDSVTQEGIFIPRDVRLTENITISSTRLSNTGGSGILGLPLCRNWLIKDCQCIHNGRNGIELDGPRNLGIINTQTFDSKLSGIFVGVRAGNGVTIRSSQVNNAGEIPLRIDNVTNLLIEDTVVTQFVSNTLPTLRLVDIFSGILRNVGITNNASNPASNGLFIRGSTNVSCQNCAIEFVSLPGQSSEVSQSNALLFAGGNTNCSVESCSLSLAARGVTVLQDDQLSGLNKGISVNSCIVSSIQDAGILIDNEIGARVLNNTVSNCEVVGIDLTNRTLGSSVRDNTVSRNSIGIRDGVLANNSIFHNFATQNSTNYKNVPLVVSPAKSVGSLENIES